MAQRKTLYRGKSAHRQKAGGISSDAAAKIAAKVSAKYR